MSRLARARGMLARQESSLAFQSVVLTGARMAGFAVAFAIPLVMVRLFDQEAFGLYKQIFLIGGTAATVLTLGLPASIFYFVSRDTEDGSAYITQALVMLGLMGVLGGLTVLLGAEYLVDWLDQPGLLPFIPVMVLYIALLTPAGVAQIPPIVDQRPTLAAWVMAGSDLARATGMIAAAVWVRTLNAVVLAAIVVSALQLAFVLLYLRIRKGRAATVSSPPSARAVREQLRYALPFAAAVLFEVALLNAHSYFVIGSVTAAQFAIYAVGILQLPIAEYLVTSVAEVMIVRVSPAWKERRLDEIRRVWASATSHLAIALIPLWVFTTAFAPDIVRLLFGPAYVEAVPILRIFICTFPLLMIVDHGVLRSTGDTGFLLKANMVATGAMVAALPFLARLDVMLGAVSAYVFGMAVARVLGLWKVASRLEVSLMNGIPWRAGLAALALSAVTVGLALLATSALSDEFVVLALGGVVFSLGYAAGVYALELVPREGVHQLLEHFWPGRRRPAEA